MSEDDSKVLAVAWREPDFEFLPPDRVRLLADESGWLRLTVEQDRSYLGVKVVRAFPHSDPDHYFGILDARDEDKVIGLIEDPEQLDAESRRIARQALAEHYFIPSITRIDSMKEEFGAFYFDVDTDRGLRSFVAKGVRDGIEELDTGELLIPDVDGNRYRIPDWTRLDARSRGFLEWII